MMVTQCPFSGNLIRKRSEVEYKGYDKSHRKVAKHKSSVFTLSFDLG